MRDPVPITSQHLFFAGRLAELDQKCGPIAAGQHTYTSVLSTAVEYLLTSHYDSSPETLKRLLDLTMTLSRSVDTGSVYGLTVSLAPDEE